MFPFFKFVIFVPLEPSNVIVALDVSSYFTAESFEAEIASAFAFIAVSKAVKLAPAVFAVEI